MLIQSQHFSLCEWLKEFLPPITYFAVTPTVVSEIHILPSPYLYFSKPMLV
jgi:hypothetical protein